MSEQTPLVGALVVFVVSDPWEFESENGSAEIRGKVIVTSADSVILSIDNPVRLLGKQYDAILCRARYQKDSLDSIAMAAVPCNAILFSRDQVQSEQGFDVRGWRGGGALVGSLSRS